MSFSLVSEVAGLMGFFPHCCISSEDSSKFSSGCSCLGREGLVSSFANIHVIQ